MVQPPRLVPKARTPLSEDDVLLLLGAAGPEVGGCWVEAAVAAGVLPGRCQGMRTSWESNWNGNEKLWAWICVDLSSLEEEHGESVTSCEREKDHIS